MSASSTRLMKPKEVAELLGIGESSVYRLASSGVLPTVRIPGTNSVRFRRERVETLMKAWEQK